MMIRGITLLFVAAILVLPSNVYAQPVFAGGALTAFTQIHSDTEPLGGTALSGSLVFGAWISPRVAIEFEPAFGRTFSSQYSYRPGPSLVAVVVPSRRDTFFCFQARTKAGPVEPIMGLAYARAALQRHATIGTMTYYDDARTDGSVAAVLGLDAPVRVAPHVHLVPTFRVLIALGPRTDSSSFRDPLGTDTSTGSVVLRYGAGARVTF